MTVLLPLRSDAAQLLARIVLVMAALTVATISPARAGPGADACFKAAGDAVTGVLVDPAKNAAGFVADSCEAKVAVAPEVFAAVSAVVTALDAAGAFGGGSCKDFKNTKIASALAAALAAAIGSNSPLGLIVDQLGATDKAKVQQLALDIASDPTGQAAKQANDILSNIPVVGQAIGMLDCACDVADAAMQSGNDLKQAVSEGGDCAQFAAACVGDPIDCAKSLFESGWEAVQDLGSWVLGQLGAILGDIKDAYCATVGKVCNWIPFLGDLCGCSGDPPLPQQVNCIGGATLVGDVRDLGNGVKVSVSQNQFCSCPASMAWKNSGGTWSCSCPNSGEVPVSGAPGICQCPGGLGVLDGACQICPAGSAAKQGICKCAIEGQTLNKSFGTQHVCICPSGQTAAGKKCVPLCVGSKVLLLDGTCCTPSQVSSCGVCCADGQTPDPKSGSCVVPFTPKPFTPRQN
jgi:hypothetical protein